MASILKVVIKDRCVFKKWLTSNIKQESSKGAMICDWQREAKTKWFLDMNLFLDMNPCNSKRNRGFFSNGNIGLLWHLLWLVVYNSSSVTRQWCIITDSAANACYNYPQVPSLKTKHANILSYGWTEIYWNSELPILNANEGIMVVFVIDQILAVISIIWFTHNLDMSWKFY